MFYSFVDDYAWFYYSRRIFTSFDLRRYSFPLTLISYRILRLEKGREEWWRIKCLQGFEKLGQQREVISCSPALLWITSQQKGGSQLRGKACQGEILGGLIPSQGDSIWFKKRHLNVWCSVSPVSTWRQGNGFQPHYSPPEPHPTRPASLSPPLPPPAPSVAWPAAGEPAVAWRCGAPPCAEFSKKKKKEHTTEEKE